MIDVIIYKDKKAIVHPACLDIPEFKVIAEREDARKLFSYIYHRVYHGSPYAKYGHKRKLKVNQELMGDENYKPDKETIVAMKLYAELSETPSSALLRGAMTAAARLKDYFEGIVLTGKSSSAQVRNLVDTLGKLDKVVGGLQKLAEQVKAEEQSLIIIGGVKVNKYNE